MTILPPILRALSAAALSLALTAWVPAPALATDPDSAAQVSLRAGWRTDAGTHMAALQVRLAPGWKTYWRAPGDAGIPPRFDWSGSRNLAAVALHWPRPGVFRIAGMQSIGYYGELILPMELTPADPSRPILLRAEVELGVCRDLCVPMTVSVSGELQAMGGGPDPAISAALAARPQTAAEGRVRGVTCSVDPIADGLRITARIDMPSLGGGEVAVFELPDPGIWVSESRNDRQGGTLVSASEAVPPSGAPFALDRSALRITVLGHDRAVEIRGCTGG